MNFASIHFSLSISFQLRGGLGIRSLQKSSFWSGEQSFEPEESKFKELPQGLHQPFGGTNSPSSCMCLWLQPQCQENSGSWEEGGQSCPLCWEGLWWQVLQLLSVSITPSSGYYASFQTVYSSLPVPHFQYILKISSRKTTQSTMITMPPSALVVPLQLKAGNSLVRYLCVFITWAYLFNK